MSSIELLAQPEEQIQHQLPLWKEFDQKFFPEIDVGYGSPWRIPSMQPGFNWLIVNARDISELMILERWKKEGGVWIGIPPERLDGIVSYRMPMNSSYVVLVRNQIEGDGKLHSRTPADLAREVVSCITLLEYLRLKFFYWWRSGGELLDWKHGAICAGSQYPDGGAPTVFHDENGTLRLGYEPINRHTGHLISFITEATSREVLF